MLQGLLAKKVIDLVIKRVMEKSELRKMRKYVEEDNELDFQIRAHAKALDKYGRYIEELEKDVAILKKDSHPQKEFICLKCGCKAKKINKRRK